MISRDSVTRFSTCGFFHESVSPKPLSIPAISNFFENSWRYSQLKVLHRWKKSSIIKVLIILFGHLWEVELTYRFCLQVHFKVSAAWYCSRFATDVNDTGVDTGGKFSSGVVDTGGAPWLANLSANFRKKLNGPNGILWGWVETDSWKKPEAKSLVTLSLYVRSGRETLLSGPKIFREPYRVYVHFLSSIFY